MIKIRATTERGTLRLSHEGGKVVLEVDDKKVVLTVAQANRVGKLLDVISGAAFRST